MIDLALEDRSKGKIHVTTVFEDGELDWELGAHQIYCFRCGVCCEKYHARLTLAEAREIANRLGVSWGEFMETFLLHCWPDAQSFTLAHRNGSCIFLRHHERYGGICSIHDFKPLSCREWNPSLFRKECQEGLHRYWGLTVSPSGRLEGTEDNLRNFKLFLKSLNSGGKQCQFTNTSAGSVRTSLK